MRLGNLNIPDLYDTDLEALIAEILASQNEKKEEEKEEPAVADTSTSTAVPYFTDRPLGNPNTTEGEEGYAPSVVLSPELLAKFKEILRVGVTYQGDIDDTVDYYNDAYNEIFDFLGQTGAQGTNPQTYIEAVGAPEYLVNLRKGVSPTEEQMLNAYGSIYDVTDTDELAAILSEYYGYDITPVENVDLNANKFAANTYKKHTVSSASDMQQFLALTRPILEDQIPYIMATQNVDYAKAIELAYLQDPMLQSLHFKYGVDPYRQTDDGSTYLFDPFSAGEIRTLEVEDKILEPAFKALFLATVGYFTAGALTGPMTSILGSKAAGAAAAKAITSGGLAALQGKDISQILTAAATAGITAGALEAIPITTTDTGALVTVTETTTLGELLPDWLNLTTRLTGLGLNPTSVEGILTTAGELIANGTFGSVFGEGALEDVINVCFLAAKDLQTEEGGDPNAPISEEYIREAIELYNEMIEEGYNHTRIMDELGYQPSEEFIKSAQARDLQRLEELRQGEPEGYIDALGKVDSDTGREHENQQIRKAVEEGEDPTNLFGLYDLAKQATELAAETDNDAWVIGTAVALEAGSEIARAFLDIGTMVGADVEGTALAQTLENISAMAGSSKPEDYKKNLQEIEKRLNDAREQAKKEGGDWKDNTALAAKAMWGAFSEHPTEFLVDYIGKEVLQEGVPFLIGGATFGLAKAGKKLLELKSADPSGGQLTSFITKTISENIDPTKVATTATAVSDAAEAMGGSAGEAFSSSYDAKVRQLEKENARIAEALGIDPLPLSEAQQQEALDFATNVAQKAGVTAAALSFITDKALSDNEIAERLFGKADDTAMEVVEALKNKVAQFGIDASTQARNEAIEEGVVQFVIASAVAEVDPDTPVEFDTALAAIMGSVIGTGTGATLSTLANTSEMTSNIAKNTAPIIQKKITDAKAGIISESDLQGELATLGITEGDIQTNLMNDAFDDAYTTRGETISAFKEANPEFNASDSDIDSYVGNKSDAELATQVDEYVDSRFVDTQEVIDAAAAEGVTLTEEEAQQYVKQTSVDDDLVLDKIGDTFDDQVLTEEETRQLLIDAGYPGGEITGETIEQILGEGLDQTQGTAATKSFLDNYFVTLLRQTLDDPNATPEQRKSLLDSIEANNPDSTAASDFNLNDDGTIKTDESGDTTDIGDTTTADTGTDATDDTSIDAGITDDDDTDDADSATDTSATGDVEGVSEGLSQRPAGGPDLELTDEEIATALGEEIYVPSIKEITDRIMQNYEGSDALAKAEAFLEELQNVDTTGFTRSQMMQLRDRVREARIAVNTERRFAKLAENKARQEARAEAETERNELLAQKKAEEDAKIAAAKEKKRDDAIAANKAAIDDVAAQLGITKKELLEALGTTEADILETLGTTETNILEALGTTEAGILEELGKTEEALGSDIDALAEELGLTKEEVLEALGQTEETLSGDIQAIADVLGKPAQDVTDADIDFVTDLIAQQEALTDPSTFTLTEEQLGYDVTGDGVVDATDLNLLNEVLAGKTTLDPLADNRFAATGVFATQAELAQEQEQQRQADLAFQQQITQQIQQQQKQAEQRAKESSARDFLSMLLADKPGRIDVGESPLADLGPAYDFGSIFGAPQQANVFASPYGSYDTRTPAKQGPFRGGFKEGGIVKTNEELLRIIGGK